MKKTLLFICLASFLWSCNSKSDEKTASTDGTTMSSTAMDLPYTASYSSNFNDSVSDADLKTVLMSYKDWADGNISGLSAAMADTADIDMSSGDHLHMSNADLMKMWSTYRDSLSSVTIDMQGWKKMYSPDHKEGHIVTWYKEIDIYKNGKADSAYYSDINRVTNGKINWYSQYKRPAK